MQRLEVTTDVFVDRATAFDFLVDFTEYAKYSEYLETVQRHGDGSPGTDYDLTFAWWKVTYTARSRVTSVDRPERIDWRLVSDVAARGHWVIEDADAPIGDAEPPDPDAPVTRVQFVVEYDPESADADAIGLPALLSIDALVDRVTPLIREEATRVVERVVADLEDEPRAVDLVVRRDSE